MGLFNSRLALTLALAPASLLAACASDSADQVPRRQGGIIVGTQGAGSEVVFPGVEVAARSAGLGDGPEYSRRDAAMNIREPMTAFDADAWPAAPQPSLDYARYLYLPRQPQQYLYFNTAVPQARPFYWQGY